MVQAQVHIHVGLVLQIDVAYDLRDLHNLPCRDFPSNVGAAGDLEDANEAGLQLGDLDRTVHTAVLNHMMAVADAGWVRHTPEEHSSYDSWKRRAVQGHRDVQHAVHGRCDQNPIAMDEADKCLLEYVRFHTRPDVSDTAGWRIRNGPGEEHDGLESGDTDHRDL